MTFLSKLYHSGVLFWIPWSIEMFLVSPTLIGAVSRFEITPASSAYYVSFLWLMAALLFQTVLKWKGIALGMVGIGLLPILYLLFIIAVFIAASAAGVKTH